MAQYRRSMSHEDVSHPPSPALTLLRSSGYRIYCQKSAALAKANPTSLWKLKEHKIETKPPNQKQISSWANAIKKKNEAKITFTSSPPTATLCLSSVLSVQYNKSLQQELPLFGLMCRAEACRLLFPFGVLTHYCNIKINTKGKTILTII